MPLAHILLPQLAKRAQELDAQIGGPQKTGYLTAGSGNFVGNGMPASPQQGFDPTTPTGAAQRLMGVLGHNPGLQSFRTGLMEGSMMPTPQIAPEPEPAPAPVQTAPTKKTKGGKIIIDLPKTGVVGVSESGQAVDRKGRKLGYLQDARNEAGYHSLERRPEDVAAGDTDALARERGVAGNYEGLRKKYKMEYNDFKANGYRWPKNYFQGTPAADAQKTRDAVQGLLQYEAPILTPDSNFYGEGKYPMPAGAGKPLKI